MKIIFSFFALALVCLGLAPALTDARVAVIASGGGIRATFGTILALDAMKKKGITDDINKFYGLSGGAWGVSWYQNKVGDTDAIIRAVRARKEGWGKMSEFSPIACGEKNGWIYNSCHLGWVKSIKKDVLLNPSSIDITSSFGSGNKRKDMAFLLDICEKQTSKKVFTKMVHTHQCSFEKSELNCVKLSDPTDFNTYDISTAKIKDSNDVWHPNSAYDWLGFTSSAWAEVGSETGGVIKKTPSDVKIKDNKGVEHNLKFCDSGATCNLPLGLFVTRESEFLGGRIHRVILLDYSDDTEPMDSLIKCLDEHWRDRFGWSITGNKVQKLPWGFRFKMTLDKVTTGVSATVYVDYIKFHGKTLGDQLIKKFPTMTTTKQPKSYTHDEVNLFYKEYYPWITEVVNAKGPDSAFDWYHSDPDHASL